MPYKYNLLTSRNTVKFCFLIICPGRNLRKISELPPSLVNLQYACFPLHGNVTLTEFRVSLCTAEVVRLSWLQTCHAESDAHPECVAVSESRPDKVSWVLRSSEPLHSNFCARGSACSAPPEHCLLFRLQCRMGMNLERQESNRMGASKFSILAINIIWK